MGKNQVLEVGGRGSARWRQNKACGRPGVLGLAPGPIEIPIDRKRSKAMFVSYNHHLLQPPT